MDQRAKGLLFGLGLFYLIQHFELVTLGALTKGGKGGIRRSHGKWILKINIGIPRGGVVE